MAITSALILCIRPRARAPLAAGALAVAAALVLALSMNMPADAQTAGGDQLRMLSADANGVELELDVAHYVLSTREVDGQKFDELSVDGTEPDQAVKGAPQLPMRAVILGIPQDAEVQISVSGLRSADLPQHVRLLPVPTPQVARIPFDPQDVDNSGVKYIPNVEAYSRDQLVPATAARVLKTGNLRSQRYAALQLYPFQYNAAQQRLQWNKHMHVSVRFVYPRGKSAASIGTTSNEGAYESILQGQLLNYEVARDWRAPRAASAGPAGPQSPATAAGQYRISTDQEGIYRLTYTMLISAGVSSAADPRTFKIRKNGVEIPINVHDADATFDSGDYVEFYAQAIDNQYTNVNVYWLSTGGSNGLPMATRAVAPSVAPALPSFRDRAHSEENHFYDSVHPQGNGDHWFWDEVTLGYSRSLTYFVQSPAVYTFTLPDASGVGTATLRTLVGGNFGAAGAPVPHYQQVYLNGNLVIDDPWVGNITRQAEGTFAESSLLSGTNVISYSLVLTGVSPYDAATFNWFEVDYDHLYRAQNDYLAFGADVSGSVQLTVTNFTTSTLAVYDVTNPTNTVIITGAVVSSGDGYALSFGDSLSATARYVAAFAGKAPLSVVRDTSQSDLRNPANGADEIIIAGDDLYTATTPLAALRASQGLRAMRVRISDVYDEFSDGVFDPLAIQRFLSYTYSYWPSPAPQYVLLVGNGNLNYRNFQPNNIGGPDVQIIPPFMDGVDPSINQVATDNHYVSFGSDNMPYMAIGRLPVRNVSETNTIINKIKSYEQTPAPGGWRQTVDFFTDNWYLDSGGYDSGGDFYATADSIATHIPTGYTITRAYYCPDPCPPNIGLDPWYITETVGADPVHVRFAITTGLNTGALFANYVGHASLNQWANEGIFYNVGAAPPYPLPDSVAQLNNGPRTPIVLELACYTGLFYAPGTIPLAQSWLLGSSSGAVADWASTGLGFNAGHEILATYFYDGVYTHHLNRVGLAINYSKTLLNLSADYPDVDEFTLFGDPATAIQLPVIPQLYLPLVTR
jgi:Peptidase family C25/Propeptide_C25